MTDYFALLQQPRRPWLDGEELKQAFHSKTLREHPDAQGTSGSESGFANLNEAYQVLRDPKRRLQHLLHLSGAPPAPNSAIPAEINALFPAVADITREADEVSAQLAGTSNALSRSLLQPRLSQVQTNLSRMLQELGALREAALVRLKTVETGNPVALQLLQAEFSYLDRWISQLEEHQLKLFI